MMHRAPSLWAIDAAGVGALITLVLAVYALGVRHAHSEHERVRMQRDRVAELDQQVRDAAAQRDRVRSALTEASARLASSPVELRPVGALNSTLVALAEAAELDSIEIDRIEASHAIEDSGLARVPIVVEGRASASDAASLLGRIYRSFEDVHVRGFSVRTGPLTDPGSGVVRLDLAWYADPAGLVGD